MRSVWRLYREALREIELLKRLRGLLRGGATVDGAEEPGLVQAQLLELLRVLGESGGKQQLLQRHLGWGQAAAEQVKS